MLEAGGDVILGDGVGDSVSFGSINIDATNIEIDESGAMVLNGIVANGLTLTASGGLTQSAGTGISVTGTTLLTASSIILEGSANTFSGISLQGGDVAIRDTSATVMVDVDVSSLTLASGGAISDSGTIAVTGAMDLSSSNQSIILDSLANTYGTISVDGGEVTITEADSSALDQIFADEFTLESGGIVTQAPSSVINVIGTLRITGDEVILDGDDNQFGDIDLTGASIAISQNGPIQLEAINAIDLTVRAGGDITQQSGSALTVTGVASFDSGSSNINLTEQNRFGSVSLVGGTVVVSEADSSSIVRVNAGELVFTSAGDIIATGSVNVSNNATFNAIGSTIALEDSGNSFGTLWVAGSDVSITESGDTNLAEVTASAGLTINSSGSITDRTSSIISVAEGSLTAAGDITIGDSPNDNISFLSVDLSGANVSFSESDSTIISGLAASTLSLESAGEITQALDAVIDVAGIAIFDAGPNDITLEGSSNQFGSIGVLEADSVSINDGGNTILDDIAAGELTVVSTGSISDSGTILLTSNTSLTAGGNISLDSFDSQFGELELEGMAVSVRSSENLLLNRVIASSLNLRSDRNILDTNSATIDVSGSATLDAQLGISIGVADNIVRFGDVSLSGSSVTVKESDSSVLGDVQAVDFSYESNDHITQTDGLAVRVTGDAVIEAKRGDSDIILDNPDNDFASITLLGAHVVVVDSSAIEIAGFDADSLEITAGGDIVDASSSIASEVRGLATFNAGGGTASVSLLSPLNEFGSVDVTALDVQIAQSGELVFNGLAVTTIDATADSITQVGCGDLNVLGAANLSADTTITLTSGTNRFGVLSITASDADIAESGGTVLDVIDVGNLSLRAQGTVTDAVDANINVAEELTIIADGDVTLGDQVGEDVRLGEVNVTAEMVSISESEEVTLGSIQAASLSVESTSGIGQATTSALNITGGASFSANNGNADVTLTQPNNSFAALSVNANDASIVESSDDGVDLLEVDSVNFSLTTDGAVTGSGVLRVLEDIDIVADDGAAAISLGNEGNRLTRVSVVGSDVQIVNDGDAELVSIDVVSLNLQASGDVTDSNDGEIEVSGLATIDAGAGGDIVLGNNASDSLLLGSVQLTGDSIAVTQTEDVSIVGLNAGSTAMIESTNGDIGSVVGATLMTIDDASFLVNRNDGVIDLTMSDNSFGELTLSGLQASVNESGSVVLDQIDVDSLLVQSGDSISNTNKAGVIVTLDAAFAATNSITLGDGQADVVQLGTVSLNAANATLIESGDVRLNGLAIF